MSGLRFRLTLPLAAASIVVGASAAFGALSDNFTNPAAPVPGHAQSTYLRMAGAKTGNFNGSVTSKGHESAIEVLALDFALTTPISPSGLSRGRAACQGVAFRKPTDQSTPLLLNSEATNETITSATFDEAARSSNGIERTVLTVRLTTHSLPRCITSMRARRARTRTSC